MSLLAPSQSVSHKRFHQCVNHKKKLSLRHPLPTVGSFSFFQASIWLGIDKVLQKLTKSYNSELRHLFRCWILIPMKCPHKPPFQHTVTQRDSLSDLLSQCTRQPCTRLVGIWCSFWWLLLSDLRDFYYSHHSKMQKEGWAKYISKFAFKWC